MLKHGCFILLFLGFSQIKAQTTVAIPATYDATIFSDSTHYADGKGVLRAGEICSANERRALIYFDLTDSIPVNATITSVRLDLDAFAGGGGIGNDDYYLHKLLENWNEGPSLSPSGQGVPALSGDVTWDDRDFGVTPWTSAGGTYESTPSATTTLTATMGIYSWSSSGMIADVTSWATNPSSNFGWILLADTSAGPCSARKFGSKDTLVAPVLYIDYECLDSNGCAWANTPELSSIQIDVYPNPSEGIFHVQSSAQFPSEISVFDLSGKVILTELTLTGDIVLDLSGFENGIYLVEIKNKWGIGRKRIVKN